jgi:SAM-dependent methyltransferase
MARYDGYADWYDEAFAGLANGPSALHLRALAGDRRGRWLDIACGTGLHFDALRVPGRDVVGIDISADQLRIAASRLRSVARADAMRLPFAGPAFDGVIATYMHTDVDDIAPVFAEAARVLRAGARFIYLGTHPCFIGPFAERRDDGRRVLHDGYDDTSWHYDSPLFGPGLRRRVGYRHVPLAELLNAVMAAGLRLEHVEEPDTGELVPGALAFVATKPPKREPA